MINPIAQKIFLLVILLAAVSLSPGLAQPSRSWFIDVETGGVFPGYSDVRIPGDSGTLFSLPEELTTPSSLYFRFSFGYQFNRRHTLAVVIFPLSLDGSGSVDRPIDFNGVTFPANTPLESLYRFNSYRLTYRYNLVRKGNWRVGVGFTAKIRDAAIKIEGGGQSADKTNVGFVPLLNFRVLWQFHKNWGMLLDGDAAAARQGRAEDVLLALQYRLSDCLALRAGYRLLEGGADVEEAYNFALIHFISAGLTYAF